MLSKHAKGVTLSSQLHFSTDLIDIDTTVVVGKGTALLLAMEGFLFSYFFADQQKLHSLQELSVTVSSYHILINGSA